MHIKIFRKGVDVHPIIMLLNYAIRVHGTCGIIISRSVPFLGCVIALRSPTTIRDQYGITYLL